MEVNPPSADYEVIGLLSMDTAAFNPMSIYFDPNEGSPVVYSKNDIHFRFWNNRDYLVDTVKTYVDANVSRNVVADTIERNTTELIASPTGNNVHWFVLDAGIGDSLAFKSDRGCALQLFAPSGDRILTSIGTNSIAWNGLTARENGFYYLAVSNASFNNPNLNVSYFHLYKYAIVDYDVHNVGNYGYSTINFVGNGFDSLSAVMFINAMNDTITQIQIGHETNTHTSVVFDFSGADTGLYRAVFLFDDYVLTIDSALRVESASDIILTSNVSFQTSFIRGSKVKYTITITNTGNSTAYNVPFYTYIGTPESDDVSFIKFDGLGLPNIFESILDSIPENEREEWLRYGEEEIGDRHHFISARGVDEETGDSVSILSGYFLMTLAPYETKTLSLNITSSGSVDVWFTIPDTIAIQSTAPQMQYSDSIPPTMLAGNTFSQYYCCWKDRIDCVLGGIDGLLNIGEILADAGEIAGVTITVTGAGSVAGAPITTISIAAEQIIAISSCYLSMLSDKLDKISNTYCGGEESSDLMDILNNPVFNGISNTSTIMNCLSGIGLLGKLKKINKAKEFVEGLSKVITLHNFSFGLVGGTTNCITSFFGKKPNCPPAPAKGGKSNLVYPIDPNEIYGYAAESGSLAVGRDVEELSYIIQFENDTTLATSNATKVYLIDTLDANLFDLSTFAARKVIIGSKEVSLNGEKEFVRTIDMRPEINSLAQVSLAFDSVNGVVLWELSTLDPITLDEINDPHRGFLPVNFNGEGLGEVLFTVNRRNDLADSTLIPNYATIIFDNNEGINTSVWQNVVDATPPQSSVVNISVADTTATLSVETSDNLSGVWKYNVFAQYGATSEWESVAENIPADSMISVRVYDGLNTGFVSIAIDSAGNMESKPMLRDADIFALHVYSETNIAQGYVRGLGSYDSLSVVSITAVPNDCYSFERWNDGNTDNPRTFTLTKDTTFSAIFEQVGFDTAFAASICEGTSYTENGFNVSEAGTYTQVLQSTSGCDSVVTLTLSVNPIQNTALSASICQGEVYTENGFDVSEAGVYTRVLQSASGCDSVVTLTLSVNPVYSTVVDATINEGETYTENGFNASEAGTYIQTLQSELGCDSTITLNLAVNASLYDIDALEYSFHPNPTSGKITFDKQVERVDVVDMNGKVVATFLMAKDIDLGELPAGAYSLKISVGSRILTRKVIKE